jgi:phosphate-selective porin
MQRFDFLSLADFLGRLELAFRYSNADIDRQLFIKDIASYGPSTQEVRTITVNLNWYPRPGLRFAAGVVETIADQDLIAFDDTDADFAFFLRTIVTF